MKGAKIMISNTIKELRKQRGWSQQMLATKLHLRTRTVVNWEKGHLSPSLKSIVELAKAFCVATDNLLGIGDASKIRVDILSQEDRKTIQAIVQAFISVSREDEEQKSE